MALNSKDKHKCDYDLSINCYMERTECKSCISATGQKKKVLSRYMKEKQDLENMKRCV